MLLVSYPDPDSRSCGWITSPQRGKRCGDVIHPQLRESGSGYETRMLLLNIYVTDLMQTCYIHVQQYQIITFAVYRGRLLLARSHFHADHAGWP